MSTASDVRGEIDIAETVRQRIQFQEEKRHGNIGSVVGRAAEELGQKEVPDREPDHDWTARFFNYIQDVSSDEMQSLWAKVLAGEIERPGSRIHQRLEYSPETWTKPPPSFSRSYAPAAW